MRFAFALLVPTTPLVAGQPYLDRTHPSRVFGEARHYRIFLPLDYESSGKRYPVIYYFHGHSDRYTLEDYDQGLDTVPKFAAAAAKYGVIVVAADGYVARDYTGFYGGTPYDVREEGGEFDYGQYFRELLHHIDSTYRTVPTRRGRATSGLSMGGFMSLFLSARYPDLVGSASAFNPGPEFFAGEKSRRSLWRPKDHVLNHEHTMIRLVRASGDYISQYHEELRAAYAITPSVNFEFRQDEYHRHWATSIDETVAFHQRAFENPALDTAWDGWNYTSPFATFEVHGYRVAADSDQAALISLEHVSQGGFRLTTRRWAPDGPQAVCSSLQVTTAPLYQPGAHYKLFDYSIATGKAKHTEVVADADGRISYAADCAAHEISFDGPGTGAEPPILLPVTARDVPRIVAAHTTSIPVRIYNPRGTAQENLRIELSSEYPTVEILQSKAELKSLAAGTALDLTSRFTVRFTAGDGDFAHVRLQLKIVFDGYHEKHTNIDVLVAPDALPAPTEVVVLDGREKEFSVFRQKGNQGGGDSIRRTVQEGRGNGNGVWEPGEDATVWLRLPQGLDPFDKNNWCRAKLYSDSPYLTEIADLRESKQREWTSAFNRTSLTKLSPETPPGTEMNSILDCESWSFQFTPDVRYGSQPLYQAFQFHKHHLFAWKWKTNSAVSTLERK